MARAGRYVSIAAAGALLAAVQAPSAFAQLTQPGYYVGVSIGDSTARNFDAKTIPDALRGQGIAVRVTQSDTSDVGWKAFLGYRFNPNFAVEGGYTSLGRFSYHAQVVADPGVVNGNYKVEDLNIFAVGIVPVNSTFEVFAKAGGGAWDAKLTASGSFGGSGAHGVSSSGVSPIVGVGGRFLLSSVWSLRLEWERFFDVGKSAGSGRADVDLVSIGFQYRF